MSVDTEVADALKTAVQTVVETFAADAYKVARERFVTFVRRGRRDEARALLNASRERVLRAPEESTAETQALLADIGPLIDATPPALDAFIRGVTDLLREARPHNVETTTIVHGNMFNLGSHAGYPAVTGMPSRPQLGSQGVSQPPDPEVLYAFADAVQQSAVSQQQLVAEVVEFSQLARRSQQEAQSALLGFMQMSALVIQLKAQNGELTRKLHELQRKLASEIDKGHDAAELQRKLDFAQQEASHSRRLYQDGRRELEKAVRQKDLAQELADEALSRLARFKNAQEPAGVAGADLDRYRRELDDLAASRRLTEERFSEIAGPTRALDQAATFAVTAQVPTAAVVEGEAVATGTVSPATDGSTGPGGAISGLTARPKSTRNGVLGAVLLSGLGIIFLASLIVGLLIGRNADGLIELDALSVSGAHSTDSSGDLTIPVRAGVTSAMEMQVTDSSVRYLNTLVELTDSGKSCTGSDQASYEIYSGSHLVKSGTVTTQSTDSYVTDTTIGKHALLRIAVLLHAKAGCTGSLRLAGGSVDRRAGGLWDLLNTPSDGTADVGGM